MFYYPAYALLIAVGLALVLPEPGRCDPSRLVRSAARSFAKELPHSGWRAIPAGVFLLALVAALAAAVVWALTDDLPFWAQLFAPDASPILALALAAAMLRLTLRLPPIWRWVRRIRSEPCGGRASLANTAEGGCVARSPSATATAAEGLAATLCVGAQHAVPLPEGGAVPHGFSKRVAAELAAPVLLFAFLGLYAAVVYRVALEIVRILGDEGDAQGLAAAAAWLTYLPAAPAQRLVILFAAVAAGGTQPGAVVPHGSARVVAGTAAATIALALLVTIW